MPHLESDSDIEKNWPRFLIVECLDEGQAPFALSKAIHSIAGGAKDIKKLRLGQLFFEVDKPLQSANILKLTFSATSLSKSMPT